MRSNLFIIPFLMAQMALAAEPTAGDSPATTEQSNSQTSTYDPARNLKERGLDPERLRFRVLHEPASLEVLAYLEPNPSAIARILIEESLYEDSRTVPIVGRVDVYDKSMRGKGIGKLMYLIGARLYYERSEKVLHKSKLTSTDADRVWDDLVRRGWAETLTAQPDDDTVTRLHKKTLAGPVGTACMQFFKAHEKLR